MIKKTVNKRACDGAPTIFDVGMRECQECGLRVEYDMVDNPMFGFASACSNKRTTPATSREEASTEGHAASTSASAASKEHSQPAPNLSLEGLETLLKEARGFRIYGGHRIAVIARLADALEGLLAERDTTEAKIEQLKAELETRQIDLANSEAAHGIVDDRDVIYWHAYAQSQNETIGECMHEIAVQRRRAEAAEAHLLTTEAKRSNQKLVCTRCFQTVTIEEFCPNCGADFG